MGGGEKVCGFTGHWKSNFKHQLDLVGIAQELQLPAVSATVASSNGIYVGSLKGVWRGKMWKRGRLGYVTLLIRSNQ